MYHKHWLHFFKKIAGVENCCKKARLLYSILKKFRTEKHSVKVQISIDTENKKYLCNNYFQLDVPFGVTFLQNI